MPILKWGDRVLRGESSTGPDLDLRAAMAELAAMTLFVTVGCGIAAGNGASDGETRLLVALGFGMAILVLAYSIGHHSGGQINCAVTLSLVLARQLHPAQAALNVVAQLLGSTFGALFVAAMFDCSTDLTGGLGSNIVSDDFSAGQALFGEILMTFLLCFVVFETAVNQDCQCGPNACIAIGFAVFLAHLVLLPIDGCSINPTRSFGPALVSAIRGCEAGAKGMANLWVMILGPLIGASLAAAYQLPFIRTSVAAAEETDKEEPDSGPQSEAIGAAKRRFENSKYRGKTLANPEVMQAVMNLFTALEKAYDMEVEPEVPRLAPTEQLGKTWEEPKPMEGMGADQAETEQAAEEIGTTDVDVDQAVPPLPHGIPMT